MKMASITLGSEKGDCRQIADSIRKNVEVAAQLMDQGDHFTVIFNLNAEQKGEIASAQAMREHIARQLTLIAVYLCVPVAEV